MSNKNLINKNIHYALFKTNLIKCYFSVVKASSQMNKISIYLSIQRAECDVTTYFRFKLFLFFKFYLHNLTNRRRSIGQSALISKNLF